MYCLLNVYTLITVLFHPNCLNIADLMVYYSWCSEKLFVCLKHIAWVRKNSISFLDLVRKNDPFLLKKVRKSQEMKIQVYEP